MNDMIERAMLAVHAAQQAAMEEANRTGVLSQKELDRVAVVAVLTSLREMGSGDGSWCFAAARKAQVAKQEIRWALGVTEPYHVGDDEIFVACIDAVIGEPDPRP